MKRFTAIVAAVALLAAVPVALAASAPSGTYKTVLTGTGPLVGTWKVTFKSGKYSVTDNGNAVVHGKYKISGADISLTDTGGPAKCPGTGKYTFKLKGTKLTFHKVKDQAAACIGRVDVLTTHPLTKV